MKRISSIALACLFATILVSGCTKTKVTLLPEKDGSVGEVTITTKGGEVTLDEAYGVAAVNDASDLASSGMSDKNSVEGEYARLLEIEPSPPKLFRLFFESYSTKLTPESREMVENIVTAIRLDENYEVSIFGHTDTAGKKELNLLLSQSRADVVAEILYARGLDRLRTQIVAMGETDPLVNTGDDVKEPKNRRVEVMVR